MSKKQIRRIGTANPKNLGLPLPKRITTPAPSGTQPASAPPLTGPIQPQQPTSKPPVPLPPLTSEALKRIREKLRNPDEILKKLEGEIIKELERLGG